MLSKKELNIQNEKVPGRENVFIEFNINEKIEEFEINMIQNNPTLAFLDMELIQINNKKRIKYEFGKKITLRDYLSENITEFDKIFEIIISTFNTLKISREYMLDNRKVILDLDNVFIDKNNGLSYLIYIPIQIDSEFKIENEFSIFTKEIISKIKKYKRRFNNYQKNIFDNIKNANLTFEELDILFEKYKKEKEEYYLAQKEKKETIDNEEIETKDEVQPDEENSLINNKKSEDEEECYKTDKRLVGKNTQSVIEEDYDEFEDIEDEICEEDDEHEDEVNYKEYKDIQEMENKAKDEKTNKLLLIQLIVVLLIGSLVLVLSFDDKEFFIMMACIMGLIILFCIVLLVLKVKKSK